MGINVSLSTKDNFEDFKRTSVKFEVEFDNILEKSEEIKVLK